MIPFLKQLRWQFVLMHRNQLINISVVITLIYGIIFYFIKDMGNTDKVLVLLVYNDPALIGLFFTGLMMILEVNQNVMMALFATPIKIHHYLISKVLALSILGACCALAMGLLLKGMELNIAPFFFGAFGTTMLFSFTGLIVVSYTTDFLLFMLKSIPALILLSLPLLNYFGLTAIDFFYWTPIQGSLNLIVGALENTIPVDGMAYGYVSTVLWGAIFYSIAFRIFKFRIINLSAS